MSVSLDDQIKCVQRQLSLLRNLAKPFVARGQMKAETADREIAAMEAVLKTLEGIRDAAH